MNSKGKWLTLIVLILSTSLVLAYIFLRTNPESEIMKNTTRDNQNLEVPSGIQIKQTASPEATENPVADVADKPHEDPAADEISDKCIEVVSEQKGYGLLDLKGVSLESIAEFLTAFKDNCSNLATLRRFRGEVYMLKSEHDIFRYLSYFALRSKILAERYLRNPKSFSNSDEVKRAMVFGIEKVLLKKGCGSACLDGYLSKVRPVFQSLNKENQDYCLKTEALILAYWSSRGYDDSKARMYLELSTDYRTEILKNAYRALETLSPSDNTRRLKAVVETYLTVKAESYDFSSNSSYESAKAVQEKTPQFGVGYYFMAVAKSQQGNFSEAREDLQSALAIEPESELFKNALISVMQKKKISFDYNEVGFGAYTSFYPYPNTPE